MENRSDKSLRMAKKFGGKIEINSKVNINNLDDLAIAYTPGVAEVSSSIAKEKEKVYEYTSKRNLVAVVTDGSAVLGLGNIGPEAAIPVMEGKSVLFKRFADIDAVPISLNTQNTEQIISHIKAISPSFGGINLEDISAPKCFEIERRLKEELDIPVFHDDQHGTAIVVLAALYNSLKLTNKNINEIKIVINGAGAAGIAIAKKLLLAGATNILAVDKNGIISSKNEQIENRHKELASITNPLNIEGDLAEALYDADVFIGVSAGGLLNKKWIKRMNNQPVIFAMANPIPEILPSEAKEYGAYIVGTGRSDFPNQINNVLAFPGIFRGALDSKAQEITDQMQIVAAKGIANTIEDKELNPDYIIPDVFNPLVSKAVAESIVDIVKE